LQIPNDPTADILDGLFKPKMARQGSNKTRLEEEVLACWRDWLIDLEGKTLHTYSIQEMGCLLEN
jgi:hypothetical protein